VTGFLNDVLLRTDLCKDMVCILFVCLFVCWMFVYVCSLFSPISRYKSGE
jgi:hypothetical protein